MLNWLNGLKGFVILLVVLGHCLAGNDNVRSYIYSFHMPMFYFIAGFLFFHKYNHIEIDIAKVKILKLFRRLMLPYYFWGILNWIVCCIVCYFIYPDSFTKSLRLIANFLIGRGAAGINELSLSIVTLWFLPSLFVVNICLIFISMLRKNLRYLAVMLATLVGIFLSMKDIRCPLRMELAFMSIPFALIGGGYKCLIFNRIKRSSCGLWRVISSFLLFSGGLLNQLNLRQTGIDSVEMVSHIFGNIILFYLSAFVSLIGYMMIFEMMSFRIKGFEYMGKNTMIVFFIHVPLIYIVNILCSFEGWLLFLSTTAFLIPVLWLMDRYLSWAFNFNLK